MANARLMPPGDGSRALNFDFEHLVCDWAAVCTLRGCPELPMGNQCKMAARDRAWDRFGKREHCITGPPENVERVGMTLLAE